ncbi:Ig-like domain-containing protein [Myxococcaceae bacterium GXIMD 01537]
MRGLHGPGAIHRLFLWVLLLGVPRDVLAVPPADAAWTLRLEVSGDLVDRGAWTLGATPTSVSGFDAFDEPHPPPLPRHFLDLVTEHQRDEPGWAGQQLPVLRYLAEYVAPLNGTPRVFELFIETDAPRSASVTWTLSPDVDLARHFVALVDPATGARADLWASSPLVLDLAAGRRTLRLELTPGRRAPPIARDQRVTLREDTQAAITLVAIDPEGDPFTYEIVTPPSQGRLLGVPPAVTYVPDRDYSGPDRFQFRASDATGPSNVATVDLTVTPENDAPVASSTSATLDEDTVLVLPLPATDVDGDTLEGVIIGQPQHGIAVASGSTLTYTPAADYHGPDAFTFAATDGQLTSSPAQVTLTVRSIPDPPRVAFRPAGAARNVAGWNDNLASTVAGAVLVSASSQLGGGFEAQLALDDNVTTRWVSASGSTTNQSLTVALPGGQSRRIHRVRLVNAYDALGQAMRDFEVRVSNTTADDAAFVPVVSGVAADLNRVQEFVLAAPVDARFVRLVALDNHGSTCCVSVRSFEAISDDASGVPSHGASPSYSSAASSENRPEAMLDASPTTAWRSAPGQSLPQQVTLRLARGEEQWVDRVRVLPSPTEGDPEAVKRFEVWTSTRLDGGFVRALGATTANSGALQEFTLSAPVRARYVRFVALDTQGVASSVKVASFEAITVGSDGHVLSARSDIVAFSGQVGSGFGPERALDLDPDPPAWVTPSGQTTNQFLTVALPEGRTWKVDRVSLQGRTDADSNQNPRDFEVQVSTTTSDPAAFVTVLATSMRKTSAMQHFLFAPVEARYVRLLLKNNHGGAFLGLQSFWIGSPEIGSVVARFLDESTGVEGPLTSWQWTLGDGATSTRQDVEHTFAAPGSYEVSLAVEDSTGLRGTGSRPYRAMSAPSASFEFTPTPVDEGVSTTFKDLSTDAAGIAHRGWDFGDGQQASTAAVTATHTFADQGVYTVTLRTTNTWGAASVVTRTVEVANRAPVVDAGPELRVLSGDNVVLGPSISDSAADAPTLTCRWDFGDGETRTIAPCTPVTAAVSRVYAAPGAYTAKLTVTDKDGASASDSVRVSVFPPECAQRGGPYLEFPYCGPYSLADLGSAPGVPHNYVGLVFKADDPNTLLISGDGIETTGALYSIRVTRDSNGQVTGFAGTATKYADLPLVDGGLVYGPGGVLFTARWPAQELVQFKPGSTTVDKRIPLTPLGLSDVSLNFVPPGFPGACGLKFVNFFDSRWWSSSVVPDGTGTFNVTSVRLATQLRPDGPEHLIYVPADSPVFETLRRVLVMEFRANRVAAYEVDDAGDPLPDSARPFLTAMPSAEAATVDPLTGDMLFVEARPNGRLRVVRGFTAPSRGVTVDAGAGASQVGTARVLTVTVSDGRGRPRPSVPVSIAVVSGPNAGASGTCVPGSSCRTDSAGQVRFQYTGTSVGTDLVRASVEGDACGVTLSGTATVEWSANRAPVARNQEATTPEDTPLSLQLSATDPDGDPLTYSVRTPPEHGVLSGTAPALTYTPARDFHGPDAFTWVANDGTSNSNEATVTLTVSPVNDAPVSLGSTVEAKQNTPVAIALSASDVDGDALTYEIVSPPSHGTLQGSGQTVTYTPATGYVGPDAFTFRARDGQLASNVATVSIQVTAVTTLDCTRARPDPSTLWPPNHKWVSVAIRGVTDASGRTYPATATAVFQDEPVNGLGDGDTSPDATLQPLRLRAERSGQGDGRIYEIQFMARDDRGGTCTGKVTVCVPHSQGGPGPRCVDSGVRHDSTRR